MTTGRPVVHICRVALAGYLHDRAFDEVVETLHYGASRIGYAAGIRPNDIPDSGIVIVIGAHLLPPELAASLRAPTVVYNFEQIDGTTVQADPRRLQGLAHTIVWDYSQRNLQHIRGLTGNRRLLHVPVGYAPLLTRIPADAPQDIDVLFYGSLNPRRQRVLDDLRSRGLRVRAAFGVYGAERDELIARARVVLNLHYYDTRIFEAVRVSYLLANRKAVVAECGPGTEVDDWLRGAACLVEYEALADACEALVGDAGRRRMLEAAGYDAIRQRPIERILEEPLAAAASASATRPAGERR